MLAIHLASPSHLTPRRFRPRLSKPPSRRSCTHRPRRRIRIPSPLSLRTEKSSMSSSGKPSVGLLLALSIWFASSTRAQTPQPEVGNLEKEVLEMRAENSAIREQLRKLEEQQKTLLQLMDELQRKLDGQPAAIAQQSPLPPPPLPSPEPVPVAQAAVPKRAAPAQPAAERNIAAEDAYQDSIILVKTPDDARIPILLR